MSDTTRTVLIALGIALIAGVLLPVLFMALMMGSIMAVMTGGAPMGGMHWLMGLLALLLLATGVALLVAGVRRKPAAEQRES